MSKSKQVVFSSDEHSSVSEVVSFLRKVADRLEQEGSITLEHGENQVEVRPEGDIELEVEYKTKGNKHELEIEIDWRSGRGPVSVK